MTVLLAGERAAGAIEQPPLRLSALEQADCATVERFTAGVRALFGRYLRLGIGLLRGLRRRGRRRTSSSCLARRSRRRSTGRSWPCWPRWRSSSSVTLINFVYLLLQMVVAWEDCAVHEAVPHVVRLLRRRTGDVLRVLAAILALMTLSTAASILATAAMGLIAFVPFVGLAALPLQVVRVARARRRVSVRRAHGAWRPTCGCTARCSRRACEVGPPVDGLQTVRTS